MKSLDTDAATYSLEHKMLDQGVQVLSENGQETLNTALKADLVVLNIAVSGKWLFFGKMFPVFSQKCCGGFMKCVAITSNWIMLSTSHLLQVL
ncbi:hypothetical protein ACFX2I_008798 [Malus domestica]